MEIKETLRALLQEMILPELKKIKETLIKHEERFNSIDKQFQAIDKRLDDINNHLLDQSRRIDEINNRMDRLYEVIVRRDEHENLSARVSQLEKDMSEIKAKLAA